MNITNDKAEKVTVKWKGVITAGVCVDSLKVAWGQETIQSGATAFVPVTLTHDANCDTLGGSIEFTATDKADPYNVVRTVLEVVCGENIPAVSGWGLIVMALLVLTAGTVVLGRRQPASV